MPSIFNIAFYIVSEYLLDHSLLGDLLIIEHTEWNMDMIQAQQITDYLPPFVFMASD